MVRIIGQRRATRRDSLPADASEIVPLLGTTSPMTTRPAHRAQDSRPRDPARGPRRAIRPRSADRQQGAPLLAGVVPVDVGRDPLGVAFAPPVRMPGGERLARAGERRHGLPPAKTSRTALARAMCIACPRSPKPVMSVAQRAPTATAARDAAALSVLMESTIEPFLVLRRERAALPGRREDPGADRLGEDQHGRRDARARWRGCDRGARAR